MIKVLFVCLGNICRSPVAEGHFLKLIKDNKLEKVLSCDSAGMASYHVGELPDIRTRRNAESNGMMLTHHARQFTIKDFKDFDYIVAMDKSNYSDILYLKNKQHVNSNSKILLMRDFDPDGKGESVPDPYMGDKEDFENVFQILKRANFNFMDFVRKQHQI